MPESIALNQDCLAYMKTLPDNYFDLAVCDPPYGDASDTHTHTQALRCHGGDRWDKYNMEALRRKIRPVQVSDGQSTICTAADASKRERDCGSQNGRDLGREVRKKIIAWDVAPEKEVFDEIFRVSRNQIIWGGNYFDLPPTRCFLVWRKLTISESFSMAMAEYAWTSFNANAKVFEFAPQGKKDDQRFHPTQKPIELYEWCLRLFAKPGDKIFDPYLGSGSSRIAAYDAGLDFVGCEIDETYFALMEERFERHTAQMNLFLEE